MDFSLLYFANREVLDPPQEYELLLRTAQFADDNGFTALWIPERHFHPFGGAYPNPALAAAALATRTRRIRLRAGSVVLPLRDPLTVVEDWAFVDNLSYGRVDLAFATGWNPNDFVLAPERFNRRREYTLETIDVVKSLWAGKGLPRRNGTGESVETHTYPRPVQEEPRLWFTCTSRPESFVAAGERGLNVLTALLFQSAEELAEKIGLYRAARERHGHDPAAGTVTLMLHTFVGGTDAEVRAVVRDPFMAYLLSSIDLWKGQWPGLQERDPRQLAGLAFQRYFHAAALFGSVDKCTRLARRLGEAGVDEIAALVDFGVDGSEVLAALPWLAEVKDALRSDASAA
ncbi:LLM class flavin-dependent oxidoreductase [Streptomyces sp. TRM S81-3]|uniref:LLM class flavin-dependent oxidoreductase n=1 Tax=Streptomyces griseicoloratus TaxID=2752516 RepID=A0A926L796_9ACTN|nr:MupA/Atu3671 family FMN-dependent luciferase-like monooxygenase [Streptomyces griseicoloratus]MBD0423932.1 LLM class flavin-dependent oxidoreductase [Streptomyces griseicoloratus]